MREIVNQLFLKKLFTIVFSLSAQEDEFFEFCIAGLVTEYIDR